MKINIALLLFICLISCDKVVPRKPVSFAEVSELERTVKINKQLFYRELELMKMYMKKDTTHTYFDSNKGFWYAYESKNDNGLMPVKGDNVVFEQEIISLEGVVLYAKKDLGLRRYVIDKEHIIKGLKEGLKIMKEGEEMKFLFSSFVAYRMNGDDNGIIGSNQPVVTRIKLVKVNK